MYDRRRNGKIFSKIKAIIANICFCTIIGIKEYSNNHENDLLYVFVIFR